MQAARKLVGKPFAKGDPRINRGGRPRQLLTKAIADTMTEADAKSIVAVVIKQAKGGDLQAVQMLWDRMEGKAIARKEQGEPGEFTGLEDRPTEELLRIVEKAG